MNETQQAASVFARIVLEQIQPETLKQEMSKAHLAMYMNTRQSVRHEAKPVDQ